MVFFRSSILLCRRFGLVSFSFVSYFSPTFPVIWYPYVFSFFCPCVDVSLSCVSSPIPSPVVPFVVWFSPDVPVPCVSSPLSPVCSSLFSPNPSTSIYGISLFVAFSTYFTFIVTLGSFS